MFPFLEALFKACIAQIAEPCTFSWISGGYILSGRTVVSFVNWIRKHLVKVTPSVSGLTYLWILPTTLHPVDSAVFSSHLEGTILVVFVASLHSKMWFLCIFVCLLKFLMNPSMQNQYRSSQVSQDVTSCAGDIKITEITNKETFYWFTKPNPKGVSFRRYYSGIVNIVTRPETNAFPSSGNELWYRSNNHQ